MREERFGAKRQRWYNSLQTPNSSLPSLSDSSLLCSAFFFSLSNPSLLSPALSLSSPFPTLPFYFPHCFFFLPNQPFLPLSRTLPRQPAGVFVCTLVTSLVRSGVPACADLTFVTDFGSSDTIKIIECFYKYPPSCVRLCVFKLLELFEFLVQQLYMGQIHQSGNLPW